MNCTGRISFAATFCFLTHLFCVYAYTTFTPGAISHYGTPIEIEYWDFKRKPIDQMVAITNELGIKVLAEHNYLNTNNIAFSPYGLMGILVALYEGVDGESSFQIQRSVPLPRDRRVIRIGFRDIHRALKTYFVPEEGFLAGLALNNENVTFTENYKNTLRFYSFELQNEPMPFPNATSNESTTMTSLTAGVTTTIATTRNDTTTLQPTTRMKEENTTNHVTESLGTTSAVMDSTTNVELDTEIITTNTVSTTTESSNQTITTTETITTQTESVITTEPSTTTRDLTTTEIASSQTMTESTSSQTTTEIASSPTISDTTSSLTTTELASPTTEEVASSTATTESISTTSINTEAEGIPTQTTPSISESEQAINDNTTSGNNLETLQRRKKSLLDFIFTNPPDIDVYQEYRSFNVGQDVTEINMDNDKHFLVNGKRIEVPYMNYDSVLHHAYLPHLEASALRLPLDSDRYYLLVVLPLRAGHGEIERLLARMARESDLSDVYEALRPRYVRAKVPSFVVKGHVILTTDLQKLGIRDVFEPRQRDFTPMTSQPGVYVRSIEQAVSVSMRKYQPDEPKKNLSKRRRPIIFTATYPFLYFVMDSTIHVSLMAGKLVDPLNSRIL